MNASMRRQRGFSLIELMVASAVGLVVALAVTTAIVSTTQQSSILGANAAAQSNAQIGLSLIDLAGRSAGAGFYNNGQALCPTWNAYNGSAVVADNARWMPVRIISGAGGASDTIIFTGGGGSRPLSAAPLVDVITGANMVVSNASDFVAGDLAVLGAAGVGDPCTLIQISGAPSTPSACGSNATACQMLVRNPNSGLNPSPTAFSTQPNYGFDAGTSGVSGPAVVSRVGTAATGFRQDAFTVQCNSLVRYNAFTAASLPPCTAAPLSFGAGVDAVATDVVLLHGQYGISSVSSSDVVTQWVEPSGATWGGTPALANIGRIKAIRVVLVARSREADASNVSAPCTNSAGVANTGPCSFEDASAPVIDLSTIAVPAGRTWRNYRYRAHTAVIPLRAVIWSAS